MRRSVGLGKNLGKINLKPPKLGLRYQAIVLKFVLEVYYNNISVF